MYLSKHVKPGLLEGSIDSQAKERIYDEVEKGLVCLLSRVTARTQKQTSNLPEPQWLVLRNV